MAPIKDNEIVGEKNFYTKTQKKKIQAKKEIPRKLMNLTGSVCKKLSKVKRRDHF